MADLPTGTLTLLFTDIEGSTRLLEHLGNRYSGVLMEHRELLRAAFRASGGHEIETRGDSFFVAFRRAVEAVTAAAAGQGVLAKHKWPDGVAVRVRMGLHTGEPRLAAGGYVGLDVHRAARLCAAAHGGQVLLSRTVRDLIADDRPPDISLRDLGEHRLRDLQRSEHIFQLVIKGLPAEFPPLKTLDLDPENTLVDDTTRRKIGKEGAEPSGRPPPLLQVNVLGGFRVRLRGEVVPDEVWRRRKARQLFKCLLTRRNHRLTKDEAVELLWPESDTEAAATNLRSAVHAIRRALEAPGPRGKTDLVVVDRDSIGLRSDADIWVDADAFERALAHAQQAADPAALLEAANALYGGDYLPEDLYEDWATERRDSLKRAWIELQFMLARNSEQRGDPETGAAALQRLLQTDPCDERAAQELMQLHLRQGRRAEALRVYQRLAQYLRDELGVEPSEETARLHRQAAAGELAASRAAQAPNRFACSYPFPAPGELIGRQRELRQLEKVLEQGRISGQTVLIGAPAGTGKSTLVGALVRRAEEDGVLCLAGGCYEQEGVVPLGPFQDALTGYLLTQEPDHLRSGLGDAASDLALVVPELRSHLNITEVRGSDSGPVQSRLFAAVHSCLRNLVERGPVMVCLEDLHAADAATLQLIHYLARQMRRSPLVLVGTFRSEETSARPSLAQLLTVMTRQRLAERVTLPPLDRQNTARLAALVLEGPTSESLNDSLYNATEGNPLFVEQLALAFREDGRVDQRAGTWYQTAASDHQVPTIIREVIGQRFERLSDRCRKTLAMAAVLGQTVQHGLLLAAVEPMPEEALLADLDEALGAQLLKETSSCYAFAHVLVRGTIYWSLSAPRRMLLHARAGETLEHLAGTRAVDRAPELAHHFGLAGHSATISAKALQYSLEAGRLAAALFSHREALLHFTRAGELLEREGTSADPETWLEVLEARGNAERALGLWTSLIGNFRRVLEITSEPLRRARARNALGYALQHTGDIAAALVEYEAGLAELRAEDEQPAAIFARLRLEYNKGYLWFLWGRFGDLLDLSRKMQPVAERLGESQPVFWTHNLIALGHMGLGQVEPALEHYVLACSAAERTEDKIIIALAHSNLAVQHYFAGQFASAHAELDRALSLYRECAGDLAAVNTLQMLGRVWLAEGDLKRAREQAELALALATEGQDRWAADCHDLLGAIHTLRTEWEAAEASFERALQVRQNVDHAAGQVESLLGLGLVHERRGDWPRALALYARAVEVASAMDPSPFEVAARRSFGRLFSLTGDHSAGESLDRALELAETMTRSAEYPATLLVITQLGWPAREPDSALRCVEQALDLGLPAELELEAHVLLSELHQRVGGRNAARTHAEEASQLAQRVDAPRLLGLADLAAGSLASAANDFDNADSLLRRALNSFEAARTPYEQALALEAHGRALEAMPNRLDTARAMFAQALGIFGKLGACPRAADCEERISRLAPR